MLHGSRQVRERELIRWGWPEDIWFHVDDLSSAHVYVRLPSGMTMDTMPAEMLEECAQLVKNNSIKGSGLSECDVVFTPWANLKKRGDMDVGQVSFHDERLRKIVRCTKDNVIVKRIEKTRVERNDYNYREERENRDARVRREEKAKTVAEKEADRAALAEQKRLHDLKHYSALQDTSAMRTNREPVAEDDFM